MTDERILSRDIEATLIPQGDPFTLPESTRVVITHRLGGNFTIMSDHGMYRVSSEYADALGEEVVADAVEEGEADGPPSNDKIWEQLRKVYDPEIPVNIVDLGLVYNMEVSEAGDAYPVHVDMTLTAPGCGMGPTIAEDARTKIMALASVSAATVEIVWDPVWNQDMISEEGKMMLGLV